jgi:hypothetical protein
MPGRWPHPDAAPRHDPPPNRRVVTRRTGPTHLGSGLPSGAGRHFDSGHLRHVLSLGLGTWGPALAVDPLAGVLTLLVTGISCDLAKIPLGPVDVLVMPYAPIAIAYISHDRRIRDELAGPTRNSVPILPADLAEMPGGEPGVLGES